MELYGVFKTVGSNTKVGNFICSYLPHDLAARKVKEYRQSYGKSNSRFLLKKMPAKKR